MDIMLGLLEHGHPAYTHGGPPASPSHDALMRKIASRTSCLMRLALPGMDAGVDMPPGLGGVVPGTLPSAARTGAPEPAGSASAVLTAEVAALAMSARAHAMPGTRGSIDSPLVPSSASTRSATGAKPRAAKSAGTVLAATDAAVSQLDADVHSVSDTASSPAPAPARKASVLPKVARARASQADSTRAGAGPASVATSQPVPSALHSVAAALSADIPRANGQRAAPPALEANEAGGLPSALLRDMQALYSCLGGASAVPETSQDGTPGARAATHVPAVVAERFADFLMAWRAHGGEDTPTARAEHTHATLAASTRSQPAPVRESPRDSPSNADTKSVASTGTTNRSVGSHAGARATKADPPLRSHLRALMRPTGPDTPGYSATATVPGVDHARYDASPFAVFQDLPMLDMDFSSPSGTAAPRARSTLTGAAHASSGGAATVRGRDAGAEPSQLYKAMAITAADMAALDSLSSGALVTGSAPRVPALQADEPCVHARTGPAASASTSPAGPHAAQAVGAPAQGVHRHPRGVRGSGAGVLVDAEHEVQQQAARAAHSDAQDGYDSDSESEAALMCAGQAMGASSAASPSLGAGLAGLELHDMSRLVLGSAQQSRAFVSAVRTLESDDETDEGYASLSAASTLATAALPIPRHLVRDGLFGSRSAPSELSAFDDDDSNTQAEGVEAMPASIGAAAWATAASKHTKRRDRARVRRGFSGLASTSMREAGFSSSASHAQDEPRSRSGSMSTCASARSISAPDALTAERFIVSAPLSSAGRVGSSGAPRPDVDWPAPGSPLVPRIGSGSGFPLAGSEAPGTPHSVGSAASSRVSASGSKSLTGVGVKSIKAALMAGQLSVHSPDVDALFDDSTAAEEEEQDEEFQQVINAFTMKLGLSTPASGSVA